MIRQLIGRSHGVRMGPLLKHVALKARRRLACRFQRPKSPNTINRVLATAPKTTRQIVGEPPGRHCGQASDWLPRQWRVASIRPKTCFFLPVPNWAPLRLSHVSNQRPQCDGPCLFYRWIFVTRTKLSTGPPKAENPTENLFDMTCACHKPGPADLGSLS